MPQWLANAEPAGRHPADHYRFHFDPQPIKAARRKPSGKDKNRSPMFPQRPSDTNAFLLALPTTLPISFPASITVPDSFGAPRMKKTLVISGHYHDRTFIPDVPLPDESGPAQLVITPTHRSRKHRSRNPSEQHLTSALQPKSLQSCLLNVTTGSKLDLPRFKRRDPAGGR